VPRPAVVAALTQWFDTDAAAACESADADRVAWLRVIPFIGMHLACCGVFWCGWSWSALGVAALLYALRMFALTGFYHRYFSHKAFKTARATQFLFALIGASCVQRGPLWWAAHHRNHHRHADTAADIHSPLTHGFWWSHMGWFLTPRGFRTDWDAIPDLRRYAELRWLDRFDSAACGWAVWTRTLARIGLSGARHQRRAVPVLGILRFHRAAVPRHGDDQFARPHVRHAPIRHRRQQPQQLAARADHVR
jgi:fatty-acid desaturase